MNVINSIIGRIRPFAYWVGVILFSLIFIGIVVAFVYNPYWLSIDACLDNGKVWDYKEKRCRDDCYLWREEFGCIKLNKNQLGRLKRCNGRIQDCDNDTLYREVCFNNNKAWDVDKRVCLFEFKTEDCFMLEGNWRYPDICKWDM